MMAEPRKPWWQVTRTATSGFWLGGLWLLFALTKWVALGSGDTLTLVTACLFSVLGAWYVASSVALRRRQAAGTTSRA